MSERGWFKRTFRITEHRADPVRDVADEIGFHHEMRERELVEGGLSASEARRVARERFGDEARIRSAMERIGGQLAQRRSIGRVISSLLQDVHAAARGLWRRPWFALVAVTTLALGIGGNVVVFSLVEAVLMRAPAVESPDRLASIWTTCRLGDPRCSSSYPDVLDYRDRSTLFADVAAYTPFTFTADVGAGAEVVGVELVTANYFALLGLTPALGRLVQPADDEPGADAALVVLSHAWWVTRYGADPAVVGSTMRVNGAPFTVIGVAPEEFQGLALGQAPEFWTLLRSLPLLREDGTDRLAERGSRWIQALVGRLAQGASLDAARAEMIAISDQLAIEDPDARGPRTVTVDALSARVGSAGSTLASFLGILQGAVALVLLLACANVANLLLARSAARHGETSVRLALGIGRTRLLRQHLTESAIIGVGGALAAALLAAIVLGVMRGVSLPGGISISATGAGLNVPVFAFMGVLTVATVLLSGAVPAVIAARAPVGSVLRAQRAGGSSATGKVRSTLIGIQIALGVVMLIGASLFIRTLRNRLEVDLGFDPNGVALITVDPSLGGVAEEVAPGLADGLISSMRALPGARSVAAGVTVPIRPGGNGIFVEVDGYIPGPDEELRVEYTRVSEDYLRTLRLPIVAGRDFTAADMSGGEPVAIIDETMASAWWRDRDAVGGSFSVSQNSYRVIGVARRTAWGGLDVGNTPFVFIPMPNNAAPASSFTLLVRADGDAGDLLPAARAAIRTVDPNLAIRRMGTMRAEVDAWLASQRTAAWLLSAFGMLAAVIAAIGIWSVVSHSVARRRRDLAVRLALGATERQVTGSVASAMLVPVGAGLIIGVAGARSLSATISSFMFGVTGTELTTYMLAAALLAGVAALATWMPARRAARTDPMSAMRAD